MGASCFRVWLLRSGHPAPVRASTFAAISDGHGSKKYWRSDSGSRLAVQALKELIENQFLPLIRDPDNDPERIKSAWELIGRDLRKKWLQLCAENLYDHPFSEEENRKAVEEHPDVIEHPVIVYGATMSGALLFRITDFSFILAMEISSVATLKGKQNRYLKNRRSKPTILLRCVNQMRTEPCEQR